MRGLWSWMTVERQVILRSKGEVRYASVSRVRQVVLAGAGLVIAGWIGFSSASYFNLQSAIDLRDETIAQGARAYRDLLSDMQESRGRFLEIAGILENNHDHLVGLLKQNKTLKGDLKSLEQKLSSAESDRHQSDRKRADIKRELAQLENLVRAAEDRNARLAGDLSLTQSRLTVAQTEHTKANAHGDKLKGRMVGLETRLTEVRVSQRNLVTRISDTTLGDIKRLNRLIAQTGLNSSMLIARAQGANRGQGGPFVPLGKGQPSELDDALSVLYSHIDRWESLQHVMRRLPFASPIDHYNFASPFGKRRDPMNRKWAMHWGLDLSGRMNQYIRSVAPGKVRFAGWKGRFGRFIEIDHGLGIRTRYGHLKKIRVKKGDTVKYRQVIGNLGSSGRSTGPHVHYEILVNGKQVNPMKFVIAGKNVFKG